ncbi:MAG: hypothetical protein VB085_11710, partial [Peptococcaceae bacterium]|nr:hypothetical protein [Peptococcaceae bacterium]
MTQRHGNVRKLLALVLALLLCLGALPGPAALSAQGLDSDVTAAQAQPGEEQPGEVQPGEGQPGDVQPGEGQPGDVQPADEQPGEGQPADEKQPVNALLAEPAKRDVYLYSYQIMLYTYIEVFDSAGNQAEVTLSTKIKTPHRMNVAPGEYTYKIYKDKKKDLLQGQGSFTVEPGQDPQSIFFSYITLKLQTQPPEYQKGGETVLYDESGRSCEPGKKTLVTDGQEPWVGYREWKYAVPVSPGYNTFTYKYTPADNRLNAYSGKLTLWGGSEVPKLENDSFPSLPLQSDLSVKVTKGVAARVFTQGNAAYYPFQEYFEGQDFSVDRDSSPDYDIYRLTFPLQASFLMLTGGEGTGYIKTGRDYFVSDQNGLNATMDVNLRGPGEGDGAASAGKFMENNLYLNVDDSGYLLLDVGESKRLEAFRVWQTVEDATGNTFFEPDFHYEIIGDSVAVEKAGAVGREYAALRALKPGLSLVKVTYDSLIFQNSNGIPIYYPGIDPENTRVIVVNVGGDAGDIRPNIGQTEFDTLYFLEKLLEPEGTETPGPGFAEYTFTPASTSPLKVRVHGPLHNTAWGQGWTSYEPAKDGSYTVHLKEGRNIIELTNAAGAASYYVVTALGVVVT